mgnify:FL=1
MNDDTPLVNVIIPAYNSAWCVAEAIDSALAQTYPRVEVLVVNDGSTDDTPRVLDQYGSKIECIYQPNSGLSAARNCGILASTGEYIVFLDADDRLLPSMVEKLLPPMLENPACALTYGGHHQIDSSGERFGQSSLDRPSGRVFETLTKDGLIQVGAAMVRRASLAQSGLFDPMLRQIEDRDLWMRLAYYHEFVFVPEYVAEYRSTPGSMSRNWNERRLASELVVRKFELFAKARNLPTGLVRAFRRSIFSHHPNQCIQDAFVHYWAGEHKEAARKGLEGVRASPGFLRNRGVVSMILRSCLRGARSGKEGSSDGR